MWESADAVHLAVSQRQMTVPLPQLHGPSSSGGGEDPTGTPTPAEQSPVGALASSPAPAAPLPSLVMHKQAWSMAAAPVLGAESLPATLPSTDAPADARTSAASTEAASVATARSSLGGGPPDSVVTIAPVQQPPAPLPLPTAVAAGPPLQSQAMRAEVAAASHQVVRPAAYQAISAAAGADAGLCASLLPGGGDAEAPVTTVALPATTLGAAVAAVASDRAPDSSAYSRITIVVWEVALVAEIVITVLFWAGSSAIDATFGQFPDGVQIASSTLQHTMLALLLVDFAASRMPVYPAHAVYVLVFAVIYLIVNAAYSLGVEPVYAALTWRNATTAWVVLVGLAIFGVAHALAVAANYAKRRWCCVRQAWR